VGVAAIGVVEGQFQQERITRRWNPLSSVKRD